MTKLLLILRCETYVLYFKFLHCCVLPHVQSLAEVQKKEWGRLIRDAEKRWWSLISGFALPPHGWEGYNNHVMGTFVGGNEGRKWWTLIVQITSGDSLREKCCFCSGWTMLNWPKKIILIVYSDFTQMKKQRNAMYFYVEGESFLSQHFLVFFLQQLIVRDVDISSWPPFYFFCHSSYDHFHFQFLFHALDFLRAKSRSRHDGKPREDEFLFDYAFSFLIKQIKGEQGCFVRRCQSEKLASFGRI